MECGRPSSALRQLNPRPRIIGTASHRKLRPNLTQDKITGASKFAFARWLWRAPPGFKRPQAEEAVRRHAVCSARVQVAPPSNRAAARNQLDAEYSVPTEKPVA
jgi:hypothetical protein